MRIARIHHREGDHFTTEKGSQTYPFCTREPLMRVVNRRAGVAWPDKLPANRLEADARTRTGDPFITSEVLYQLSYVGAADPV